MLPFWAPAAFTNNYRNLANLIEVYALGFDCDQGQSADEVLRIMAASGLAYVVGATRTHQLPKHGVVADRLRVLVPLAEPVGDAQYRQAHQQLREQLGLLDDEGARDPSRGWFGCREVLVVAEGSAYRAEPLRANAVRQDEAPIRNPVEHFRRAMADALDEIREAPKGRRDIIMNNNVYGIGRLLEAAGADEFKVAREFIDTCVAAGYDIVKVNAGVPRILRDGMANPREVAAVTASVSLNGQAPDSKALLPLPDKTRDKPAYQAWMSTLRNACDAMLVVAQYDQARVLYERVEARRVEVRGSADVQSAAVRAIGRKVGLLVPRATADAFALDYRGNPDAERANPTLWDSGSGFYRWQTPPVAAGPTPTWDGILTRLSDVDAFLAHVWAAFEPQYKGRQVMWLQGEGSDGKTIALKAIFEGAIGPNAVGIANDDDIVRSNQFLFSAIWDKVAMVVNDSKQVNLMMTGLIHRLTGRDYIGVEYKHGPRFSAEYQGVVWVTSNLRPNIEGNRSNLSRLTILTLKPGDWVDDLAHRLRDEMPALLHRARDAYSRACPRHYEIALNATSLRLLNEATGGEADTFRAALLAGGFVFDAVGWVTKAELVAALRLDMAQRTSLYRWLRAQPSVKESADDGDRGFKGLRKNS